MQPAFKPNPLRSGSDADFQIARSTLQKLGFVEARICERLGIAKICDVPLKPDPRFEALGTDPLDLLIRLFLEGASMPRELAGSFCADQIAPLGLIADDPVDPQTIAATVLL